MSQAMIEDWDQFNAFLAAQPLCQWLAQKQQEDAAGATVDRNRPSLQAAAKNDNADLLAALSSMA